MVHLKYHSMSVKIANKNKREIDIKCMEEKKEDSKGENGLKDK